MQNTLYYGDNLVMLRRYVPSESVDLIYLDPPFNSDATYNVLFKSPTGKHASAQIRAFEDTWHWGEEAELAYEGILVSGSEAAGIIRALRSFLGENDLMAYLAMMAARLIEMHRVLKQTGSLYLHCDPTASHYLKIILDGIFGAQRYRNELTWKRTTTHSDSKTWSKVADTILFYTKGDLFTWNTPREKHSDVYVRTKYRHDDGDGRLYMLDNMTSPNPRPNMMYEWMGFPHPPKGWRYSLETMGRLHEQGRVWYPKSATGAFDSTKRPRLKRYLEEMSGGVMGTVWTDISPINSQAQERLGYPTQKPLSLLERIICTSSNPGDVVLDPFCGCGTAVHAAQALGRSWTGIDVTHIAIQIIEDRLEKHFPGLRVNVLGRPQDIDAARDLAQRDKYQFQWWATWLVGGRARGGERKGADRGVDGDIYFSMGKGRDGHGVISVKGGAHLGPQMIRDLKGTRERESAEVGLFVCLEEPSREMRREASSAGILTTPIGPVSRIQIYMIEELLAGAQVQLPPIYSTVTVTEIARERRPAKAKRPSPHQREMLFPVPGSSYAAAEDVPLLEAAEDAAAFDHERQSVVRRRAKR